MDTEQLRELAGTPLQLNEDVSAIAAKPKDQIIEALAIACLESDSDINHTIQLLREAYMRSKNGRSEGGY